MVDRTTLVLNQRHSKVTNNAAYVQVLENSPTRNTFRSRAILDALASFCIQQDKKGEVVANPLEKPGSPPSLVFYIATNGEVPETTLRCLRHLWSTMQVIAAKYYHYSPLDSNGQTPLKKLIDNETRDLLYVLTSKCLIFFV